MESQSIRRKYEDMVLLHGGSVAKLSGKSRRFDGIRSLAETGRSHPYVLRELLELIADPGEIRNTCYLPAVRGGIMQSHRMIASALVTRSTRAGFERFPRIPTFSGGVADFMQRLILYNENRARS